MAKTNRPVKNSNFLLLIASSTLILIIFLILFLFSNLNNKSLSFVKIGDKIINVEIADTENERVKGLSGKEVLGENAGMLFIFDEDERHPIWMKGMKFPIDIIWINNGVVVDIVHQAIPEPNGSETYRVYRPKEPAKYILEVNANFSRQNEIKIGDVAESNVF